MVKFVSAVNYEYDKNDKLSDFELREIKEAFDILDNVVDRYTKSGALVNMWHLLSDIIEFNEDEWYKEEEYK